MASNSSMNLRGYMLGRYQLLRLLGKGGMGEVWLAEDSQLRRQVAIKILLAVLSSDKQYLRFFEDEAQAVASLEHPNILPVHDFGEQTLAEDEVVTYLVMPYVTGGTLRTRVRAARGPIPLAEAMHYLGQAAQAIDYAHSRQILHRDIKPANMLLQQNWLFLADFGIAKLLTSQRTRTHAGAGTPHYMAPEQAQGNAGPASDRYSLAVVAYQLFTGWLPFNGNTPYDVLLQQMQSVPTAPHSYNASIPPRVEETLLRGLAKAPEQRYASCKDFFEDLQRGWGMYTVPTVASPPPIFPVAATQGTAQTGEIMQPLSPRPYPSQAIQSPQINSGSIEQVPTALLPQEQPAPTHSPNKIGRRSLLIGGSAAALALIGGSAAAAVWISKGSPGPIASKPAAPSIPGPRQLSTGRPVLTLTGHSDTIWNVAWDPTGRYLATAGKDTRVMLWDVGHLLQGHPGSHQSLAHPQASWKFEDSIFNNVMCWSSNGKFILVTDIGGGSKLYVIDITHPSNQPQAYHDTTVPDSMLEPDRVGLSWQPGTNTFAAADAFGLSKVEVSLWDLNNTTKPASLISYNHFDPRVEASITAWSHDGSILTCMTNDGHILLWDVKTKTLRNTLSLPDRFKKSGVFVFRETLVWSPTDPHMLMASNTDVLTVWDVRKPQASFILGTDDPIPYTPPKNAPNGWVPNVLGGTWSSNGRYIAGSYGRSSRIYIWDLEASNVQTKNGARIQQLMFPQANDPQGHNDTITDMSWSPDGRYLATASFDKTVIIWKVDGAS